MSEDRIKVVVSGSFRRHLSEIKSAIQEFEALGVQVLSPKVSPVVDPNPTDGFVLLESDETDNPRVLEQRHLEAIALADMLYICNPGGYIGNSVHMEFGAAWSLGRISVCSDYTDAIPISCLFTLMNAPPGTALEFLVRQFRIK